MKITTKDLRRIIKEEMYMLQNEASDDAEKQEYKNKIIKLLFDNVDNEDFVNQGLELAESVNISLAELAGELNRRMNADKSGETKMNFGLVQHNTTETYKRVWKISQHIMKNNNFGENDKFAYLKVLGWQYAEDLVCLIPNMCDE